MNSELIQKLEENIDDWNKQAALWERVGDTNLAAQCKLKAKQWADVIRLFR